MLDADVFPLYMCYIVTHIIVSLTTLRQWLITAALTMKIPIQTKPGPLLNFYLLKLQNSAWKLVLPLCSCTACAQCCRCLTSFYTNPGTPIKKKTLVVCRDVRAQVTAKLSEVLYKYQVLQNCMEGLDVHLEICSGRWVGFPARILCSSCQGVSAISRLHWTTDNKHNSMKSVPDVPLLEIGKHCMVVTHWTCNWQCHDSRNGAVRASWESSKWKTCALEHGTGRVAESVPCTERGLPHCPRAWGAPAPPGKPLSKEIQSRHSGVHWGADGELWEGLWRGVCRKGKWTTFRQCNWQ